MLSRLALARATALPTTAMTALTLAACGSTGPSLAQLRATVNQYLTASTPSLRCSLYTTTYRTMNPDVLLSGGCERSEQLTPAEEAARRQLTIGRVTVRAGEATVTLRTPAATTAAARLPNDSELTGIYLVIEHAQWRIDGFAASASSGQVAGT
jgi:hypothetical protein